MKKIIFIIILIGLGYTSGVLEPVIITEEKIKEREFEDPAVKKMQLTYKLIINPLRERFGEIYITSGPRYNDIESYHEATDTTVVVADIDQDVLIDRGCDTCATNKEIYDFIKYNWPYWVELIPLKSAENPGYLHIAVKIIQKDNNNEIWICHKYYSKKRKRWVKWYERVWYKKIDKYNIPTRLECYN